MSEAERKRRFDYKQNRKKWLMIQAIAIALVAVIALSTFLVYYQMNKTYYIHYTEDGAVDYKVYLKDNDFFEEEYLGKGQAYVSSLIDYVVADFSYAFNMDIEKADFDYSYRIDTQLLITDKTSGKAIYDPTYELCPAQLKSVEADNSFEIKEQVRIDYVAYNNVVKSFIETYQTKDYKCNLVVKMSVEVLSQCDEFEQNNENTYFISMNIPLAMDTVDVTTSSSIQSVESKVLACSNGIGRKVFKVISIVAAVIDLLLAIGCIIYVYKTRNEDINYTIKVKRLVSAYRSYIQKIKDDFDLTGHQVVEVKTFTEMLGIRDTIQAPILMSENEDKTRSQFIIPTSTELVYMFEIKVDNYDELYNTEEE